MFDATLAIIALFPWSLLLFPLFSTLRRRPMTARKIPAIRFSQLPRSGRRLIP